MAIGYSATTMHCRSHERHGVSNYRLLDLLHISRANNKNIEVIAQCRVHLKPWMRHFTPQPSRLEGYCHSLGGRAGGWEGGGCQNYGTYIPVTVWWIFSARSSVELCRPVVVHCYGHLPICLIWSCPWAKNFVEPISLKPLDGFTSFIVS